MTPFHLLLIEDDASVAKGLIAGLEQEGFRVTWADTGAAGLAAAREGATTAGTDGPGTGGERSGGARSGGERTGGGGAASKGGDGPVNIDLIILDLRLPDMSGFDVARQIRGDGNTVPILILTASDDEVDTVLGLELGADEYVTKPFRLRPLTSRIKAMLRRTYGELAAGRDKPEGAARAGALPEGRTRLGRVTVDRERLRVTKDGADVFLTPTELRILLYLLDRPERPVTRDMIVAAVWGDDYILEDPRTVDVHVRHLREKLEDNPAEPVYIRTVRGVGYVLSPPEH
ncbi:MAG: response regulator transcription factor [Spirochaetota bacterium]